MASDTALAYQHLHKLLLELADVEYGLAHGPKRIAAGEKKVAAAEQLCLQQKEKIKKLRQAADEASLNLKTREANVQKHKGRLNEAGSNKEYEIITGQINAEKQASAELEDEILAMLGTVDEATEELTTREAELDLQKSKIAEAKADVSAKEPGLNAEVARLQAEISEAEKVMTGESRATFIRMRQTMGAGTMSQVDGGYCEECNTAVTPQDLIRLNMGEFQQCRACGRILYFVGNSEDN